eukprot:8340901-Pyramimonas_sp.AAC.1
MQAEINELKGLLNAVRTETPPSLPPGAAFHRKTGPTILVVRTASLVAKEAVCEGLAEWLTAPNFEQGSWT